MAANYIRVIAICVFRHDDKILVFEAYDTIDKKPFYRPLGGAVEFGETTETAIKREIREEIGQ
jgi:NADH pyrophosphatase NudC (nudix superfamily)